MVRSDGSHGRQGLMELEERLRSWRGSRKRGEKVPRELWQAAVALASRYSLDEIASTLALNRGRLEKQVKTSARTPEGPRVSVSTRGQGFVEVGALSAGNLDECTVEAEDGAGRKLTVHLRGGGCRHAIEIAKVFWSVSR